MAWLSVIVPALVLAAILYVPGIAVNALFLRKRLYTVGFAPVTGAAILGFASLASGVIPGHWSLKFVLCCEIGVFIVVAGIMWLCGSRPRDWLENYKRLFSGWAGSRAIALLGALIVNAVIAIGVFVRSVPSPQAFFSTYDTPFHMSVIRWLIESGDGSSLHSAVVDGTVGSHFYPALWHGWVSMVISGLGTPMTVAINASCLVILLSVWPLSAAVLTDVLFGEKFKSAPVFALFASSLFAAYPWGLLAFGVLYSNFFSYALAPAYLAAFVALLRGIVSRAVRGAELCGLILIAIGGFASIALAQPNSVFTLAVILFPYLIALAFDQTHRRSGSLLKATTVSVLLVLLAAAAWYGLYKAPFMQRTVTWRWDSFESPLRAFLSVIILSTNTSVRYNGQLLLALCVAIGVVLAVKYRRTWLVISYAFIAFLYVLSAGFEGDFRNMATGFWYHDSYRPAGAMSILAVPLMALALAWCYDKLFANQKASLRPAALLRGGAFAVVLVVIAAVTLTGGNMRWRIALMKDAAEDRASHYTDSDEIAFMDEARKITGTEGKVANDPFDGSMFGYATSGLPVVFTSMPGNWIGQMTPDAHVIIDDLYKVSEDPQEICPVIQRENIRYVIVLERHRQVFDEHSPWKGIRNITPETPGFERVLERGPYSLYKITACGLG